MSKRESTKQAPPGVKKKNKPGPGGRPTAFDDRYKDLVRTLARKGATEAEISKALNITRITLYNWKKAHPEFFNALNDWKSLADSEVERSLYERARGYTHPETVVRWVSDESGSRWEKITVDKHYPPDPTSMIFWLKNRQPEQWREKQDISVSGDISISTAIPDPEKEDRG